MILKSTLLASLAALMSLGSATPLASTGVDTFASISSSNVATDLKLLYGGDNPSSFDIGSLAPTSDDYDSNFKFLCMYPYSDDLYIYLYDYESHNYDFYYQSEFVISLSTDEIESEDDLEDGQVTLYNEVYNSYTASFMSSYGYQGRFAKFVINDILNPSLQQRVYIDSCTISYVNAMGSLTTTGNHEIVNEIFIDDTGLDLVYEYYQEDYVKIDNSKVACLLTPSDNKERVKSSWNGNSFFGEYYEDFYYFFEEDPTHPIDELVEVRYDYTLVTYDAYTTNKGNQLTTNREVCYNGLIDGTSNTLLTDENDDDIGWMGYVIMVLDPNIGFAYLGDTISNGSREDTWDQSIVTGVEMTSGVRLNKPIIRDTLTTKWAWRTKEKTYQIDGIIDLNDENAYSDDIYWNQNDFTSAVNSEGVYDWAFLITEDLMRETTSWEHTAGWWIFNNTYNGISECHEVVDAMVTYLRYYTDGVEFSLEALSNPTSTSFIGTSGQVMSTLHDQIVTVFSSLTSTTNNILMWIGIILGIIAGLAIIGLIIWACVKHHNNKKSKTVVNVNTYDSQSGSNTSKTGSKKQYNNSKNNCKNSNSKTYYNKNYYDKDRYKNDSTKRNKG